MAFVIPEPTLRKMADRIGDEQTEYGGSLVVDGAGNLVQGPQLKRGDFDAVYLDPAPYLWHTHPARCVRVPSGSMKCTYSIPSAQDLLTMKTMAADGILKAHVVCTRAGWFVVKADANLCALRDREVVEAYSGLYRKHPQDNPQLADDFMSLARSWGLAVTFVSAGAPRSVRA